MYNHVRCNYMYQLFSISVFLSLSPLPIPLTLFILPPLLQLIPSLPSAPFSIFPLSVLTSFIQNVLPHRILNYMYLF